MKNDGRQIEMEVEEVETTEVVEKPKKRFNLSTRAKVGLGIAGGFLAGIIVKTIFSGSKDEDEGEDSDQVIELSDDNYEVQ